MKLRRSVATILFPQSRRSLQGMRETLSYLRDKVAQVEFYYEGGDNAQVARALEQTGLDAVFIGVIPSKEQGLSLCSLDPIQRAAAVQLMKDNVDVAYAVGARGFMVCSGKYPAGDGDVPACIDAFADSMEQVIGYADRKSADHKLDFCLEPCDSHMDAKHLLGGTGRAVEAVEKVLPGSGRLTLTMDTAHVMEEGEDFLAAMALAKPHCRHVHFANCVTKNPADPFYGDKHVDFDYPGSDFPYGELEKIFHSLDRMYNVETLTIALESLCRREDPFENFERIMEGMPWFFGA